MRFAFHKSYNLRVPEEYLVGVQSKIHNGRQLGPRHRVSPQKHFSCPPVPSSLLAPTPDPIERVAIHFRTHRVRSGRQPLAVPHETVHVPHRLFGRSATLPTRSSRVGTNQLQSPRPFVDTVGARPAMALPKRAQVLPICISRTRSEPAAWELLVFLRSARTDLYYTVFVGRDVPTRIRSVDGSSGPPGPY